MKNKQYHIKELLGGINLNGHKLGFYSLAQKLSHFCLCDIWLWERKGLTQQDALSVFLPFTW